MSRVRTWIAATALIVGCRQDGIDLGSGLTDAGQTTMGDTAASPDGGSGSGSSDSGGEPLPYCDTLEPSAVVFINFDGAEIVVGPTDATENRSAFLQGTFPPYGGDGAKRQSVFEAARSLFSPFNIAVVDRRPLGIYDMVMVGPSRSLDVGFVGGESGCQVQRNSVAFVIAHAEDGLTVAGTARRIAHGAAWGLGLETAEAGHPEEIMSDAGGEGPRTFTDACLPTRDLPACGPAHFESCGDAALQNSFAELMTHWGPCPD